MLYLVAPYVGAWIETTQHCHIFVALTVAPYVGAWIETFSLYRNVFRQQSHPMWVRGLKLVQYTNYDLETDVAPYVGAWIETLPTAEFYQPRQVAPYVGAWIETLIFEIL